MKFLGRRNEPAAEVCAADWRRPVEALEDRRLLSGTVPAVLPGTPIVTRPGSPVTGLTVHGVDDALFSGPVGVWVTTSGLPKAGSGLTAVASIQWGDGTSSAGTLVQDSNGLVQIDGSHTWAKPGTFNTVINIAEVPTVKPGQYSPQYIVEVGQGNGKAIVAGRITGSVTIYTKIGLPFDGTVAQLDFHVPAKPGIGEYAAMIDWGDGKISTGMFASSTPTGNSDVIGSHTYAKAGKFNVHVVVTFGPRPGSGAEFATRVVAIIDSTAFVAKPIVGLDGTITGTYKLAPANPDIGATYVFAGTGAAGALGPVSASGSVHLPGFISTGKAGGTLKLTGIGASPVAGGSVTLKLTGPTEKGFGPFPTTLHYVITGGTGAFANVAGSGTISVTLDNVTHGFIFVIHSFLPPVVV